MYGCISNLTHISNSYTFNSYSFLRSCICYHFHFLVKLRIVRVQVVMNFEEGRIRIAREVYAKDAHRPLSLTIEIFWLFEFSGEAVFLEITFSKLFHYS